MSKFEVGQKVHVSGGRFSYSGEATVTKVGRKYMQTDRTRETKFDIATGIEAGTKYGIGERVYRADEWAAKEKRQGLESDLREAGLDIRRDARFTDTQLENILAAATTEGEK